VILAALPRCSPDAPSTLLTLLSSYSAGHPPRSNFKSPASIFPVVHWDIDTHGLSIPSSLLIAASHSFPLFLRLVTPSVRDRCFFDYRYRRCGVATCSLRYFHLLLIFPFSCVHRSPYRPVPIDRLSRRLLPWLMVILQHSRYVFAFLHSSLFHPFSLHTSSLVSLSPLSRNHVI